MPIPCCFVPFGADQFSIKKNVLAQLEFISNETGVAQCFGLRREVLSPLPLLKQLFRKRVAVAIAFRIKTRAGVTIPIPSAAHIAASLNHAHRQAKLSHTKQLIHTAQTRPDNDDVEFLGGCGATVRCLVLIHFGFLLFEWLKRTYHFCVEL